jgi:hypothetical protein
VDYENDEDDENDAPFSDEPEHDDDDNNDDGEYDEMDPDEIEGLAYNPTRISQVQHEHDDDQEEEYLEDYSDDNNDNAKPRNEGEADCNIDEYVDIHEDDEPNAFVQTGIEPKEKGKRVIMKI